MANMAGGWSETRPADAEIQKICDQVKDQVEKKTGKKYENFRIVQYRKQNVEGDRYIMKLHVGGDNYCHAMVSPPMCEDGGIKVCCIQWDKTEHDSVEPFEC